MKLSAGLSGEARVYAAHQPVAARKRTSSATRSDSPPAPPRDSPSRHHVSAREEVYRRVSGEFSPAVMRTRPTWAIRTCTPNMPGPTTEDSIGRPPRACAAVSPSSPARAQRHRLLPHLARRPLAGPQYRQPQFQRRGKRAALRARPHPIPATSAHLDAGHAGHRPHRLYQVLLQLPDRLRSGKRRDRDPYALWDIYAGFSRGQFHPFLQLSNVTATSYEEIQGVIMPGRSVIGGVEWVLAKH